MKGKTHGTIGLLTSIEVSLLSSQTINPLNLLVALIFSLLPDIDEPDSLISKYIISRQITKNLHRIILYAGNLLGFYLVYSFTHKLSFIFIFCMISTFILEKLVNQKRIRRISLSFMLILTSAIFYYYNFGWFFIAIPLILSPIPWLGHRNITHSITSVIILYYLLTFTEMPSTIIIHAVAGYSSHLIGDFLTKQGIPLFYPFSKKRYGLRIMSTGSKMGNFVELLIIVLVFITIYLTYKYLPILKIN